VMRTMLIDDEGSILIRNDSLVRALSRHPSIHEPVCLALESVASAIVRAVDCAAGAESSRVDGTGLVDAVRRAVAAEVRLAFDENAPPVESAVRAALSSDPAGIARDVAVVKQGLEGVRVEQRRLADATMQLICKQTATAASSAIKGRECEETLVMALRGRLLERDGWSVRHVGTEARGCDVAVDREDRPRVRVEVKRKKRVDRADLDKFRRDLADRRDSGVFLSCSCHVPGYGPGVTIYRAARGRFEAVVSPDGPGSDMPELAVDGAGADLAVSAVYAIHALCAESTADADDRDGIVLDAAACDELRTIVRACDEDVRSVQNDVQTAVHACNRALTRIRHMTFRRVMAVVEGGEAGAGCGGGGRGGGVVGRCVHCGREFKVAHALRKHETACPERRVPGTAFGQRDGPDPPSGVLPEGTAQNAC
jgi:hypothetical protein